MRADAAQISGLIGNYAVSVQYPVKYLIQFRVVYGMNVGKQMVGNMIVESAENKIRRLAKRVHVVRAFDLVHDPRRLNIAAFVKGRVFNAFHVVCHKERKQQKQRLA